MLFYIGCHNLNVKLCQRILKISIHNTFFIFKFMEYTDKVEPLNLETFYI